MTQEQISGTEPQPMIAKKPRGFAAMSVEARREISAKGGRESHRKGTGHEFNSEEARAAGRKGGEARAARSGRDLTAREVRH